MNRRILLLFLFLSFCQLDGAQEDSLEYVYSRFDRLELGHSVIAFGGTVALFAIGAAFYSNFMQNRQLLKEQQQLQNKLHDLKLDITKLHDEISELKLQRQRVPGPVPRARN